MSSYHNFSKVIVISYFVIISMPVRLVSGANIGVDVPDQLLSELYSAYKEALHVDEGTVSSRRVFTDNKKYQIHVMKLNEVNGNKRHNLLVKEDNSTNPLIYIDNPVETKIPNAYLTFEEFKKELTSRVLRLREDFVSNNTKGRTATENVKAKSISNNLNKEGTMLKLFLNDLIKQKPNSMVNNKTKQKNTPAHQNIRSKTVVMSKTPANTKLKVVTSAPENVINSTIGYSSPKEVTTVMESQQNKVTKSNIITENSHITAIEISVESPIISIITENPNKPEVTELSKTERYESTAKYEIDSTFTTEGLTPEATTESESTIKPKRTTLSRPLVWMEGSDTTRT